MTPSLARKGLIAFAALLAAGLLVVAALPVIASTQIVRDRIAHELSFWSGYRVTIPEAPEISVWPVFRARLTDVALSEWGAGAANPVLEAETIELDLSPLPALRGEIVFSRVALIRPLLRVAEDSGNVPLPPPPSGGRLAAAIADARSLVREDGAAPQADLPEQSLGIVEFRDGRVVIGAEAGSEPVLTSLSGRLNWPNLNRAATLDATGIWRGESVTLEASSAAPLVLAAGGRAPLRLSLASEPASLSFQGEAALSEQPFLEGQATLSSPSFRRMLEWSRATVPAAGAIGAVQLSATVAGAANRLKLESVQLDLGGSQGNGVLEVALDGDVPTISGTLAFASLNLRGLLAAFSPMAAGQAGLSDPVDTGLGGQAKLDLRLSAANATLGPVSLAAVGATLQVRDGLSAIDISDAAAFGGNIQAGLRVERRGEESAVEFKVLAEQLDAGAVALQAGMKRVVPQARASLSLISRGVGTSWHAVLADAEGTLAASLGEGTLIGIDLTSFLAMAGEGRFFPLADAAAGTLPIRSASLKATIDNGVVRVDRAQAIFENKIVRLAGIVPYLGRALALSGDIGPTPPDGAEYEPDQRFFIGGGWDAPYVAPVSNPADF